MNSEQQSSPGPVSLCALLWIPSSILSHPPASALGSALNPRVKIPAKTFILLIREAPLPSLGEAEEARELALLTSSCFKWGKVLRTQNW